MTLRKGLLALFLVLVSLLLLFPFLWLLAGSFKSNAELFSPLELLPSSLNLEHYRALFTGAWLPYASQYFSMVVIVLLQTALVLLSSNAAGFVFAHYSFPGRRLLYALALSVIFIPKQVLIVPLLEWLIRSALPIRAGG